MMLGTIITVCFVLSLHVTANEYYALRYYNTTHPTLWDSFEWKITVRRLRQDEIILRGLLDHSLIQDEVKIPGASCSDEQEWAVIHDTTVPGFVMRCRCHMNSSTFIPKLMGCAANNYLKQGCQYTSGSWRWSTSWVWDTKDDALITMDEKRGITTAFNATSTEYQSCSVVSISYWKKNATWGEEESECFLNESTLVMFPLRNMWHLSWNVKKMKDAVKESLNGKILKFSIECEKPGPPQDEDEELEMTSCLIAKVTGVFNVTSEDWELAINNLVHTGARTTVTTPTNNHGTFLLSVLVPCATILVAVCVLTAVCYIRRAALQRHDTVSIDDDETLPEDTVLDHDMVQTKLIENNPDESVV